MPAGVLLVTARSALAAQVQRLCALSGSSCEVARESGSVRSAWRRCDVVLVGADLVAAVAAAALPARNRVVVVTDNAPDASCWNAALALGARRVLVLPEDQVQLVDELRTTDLGDGARARVIGVVGGCGGAGASTFACGLALTAGSRGRTLLMDGDPLGGGIDVLLGAEGTPGLRWPDLAGTRGRLDPVAFADAMCQVGGITVLAWGVGRDGRTNAGPVPADAVSAAVQAAIHGFATVVVDLPRCAGLTSEVLCDAVEAGVLLVPAEVRAVSAAASVIDGLGSRLAGLQLVVRESSAGLTARDVASSLGLPLIATCRDDPAVRAAGQRGELPLRRGRGALAETCEAVLTALVEPAMSR